jgi:hypothetical protein
MSGREGTQAKVWTAPDGSDITEPDAANLAAEFESDDSSLEGVSIVYPRRVGRPSLAGQSGRSPQVTFRLPAEKRELAEKVAAARGTTVSALAREALEDFLRRTG